MTTRRLMSASLVAVALATAAVTWLALGRPAVTSGGAPSATIAGANDDGRKAREVLGLLKSRYRYLDGVIVELGTTPAGREAVAYYSEGRIVISREHKVDVATILDHEVWHVIDWRKDGRLDWGEHVPPGDARAYLQP